MSENLLSIIIPTKNRKNYCKEAIKTVVNLNFKYVQIVIQDNSDDDELKEYCSKYDYSNIVYNYHPGELSFVDNFSESINLADGKYLCMIGDDDGVLPNIIEAVQLMESENLDALIPGLNSVYIWPNSVPIVKNGENGYLCLSYISNTFEIVDCSKGLNDLLKRGGQNYQTLNVPRLYHGIVKKSIIDEVYKKTGMYFDGLTPDIYMSAVLAIQCNKCGKVHYPVTVSGICPKSGSSDSATGKHTGELKNAPHFKGHSNYVWDKKAPAIYSVESIWAETVMHALHNMKREDLYNKFNVSILDAECLNKYPQFRVLIYKHMKELGVSTWRTFLFRIELKYGGFIRKAFKRLIRKKDDAIKYYDIDNIHRAIQLTVAQVNRVLYK